jgi:hypothetical protein
MIEASVGKLCGRALSAADLETIRRGIGEAAPPLRAEVARQVCDALGRPKLMSCRVGLLRLHRAGLIGLPAARNGNGQGLLKQPDAWPAEYREYRGKTTVCRNAKIKKCLTRT